MFNDKIIANGGLTFDDVLLLPNYTEVKREDINLETQLTSNLKLTIPLITSPMDTVTESQMAISIAKLGGLGIIHRNFTIEKQTEEVKKAKNEVSLVGAAVGIGRDLEDRVKALINAGLDILLIDSAHGFSRWVIEATHYIAQNFKKITLISGSIGTGAGAKALIDAGADILRVGMGPGSICTTRIISGMGIPQITAIMDTVAVANTRQIPVIADGGLRNSGDIVKALAAGAATVMSGSLFSGTKESPGKIVFKNGHKYKLYRGMGSLEALKEGSAARYGQEYHPGMEKKLIAEGVESLIPYKGTVEEVVVQLVGGIKAGLYYTGTKNITELHQKSRFIKISHASLIESHPHDINS